jgi:hypothetical protein
VWNKIGTIVVNNHASLRHLLAEYWVQQQIHYYHDGSRKHRRRYLLFAIFAAAVLSVTVAGAVAHAVWLREDTAPSKWVALLAIALPALLSAVAGVSTHQQHEHHAAVYSRMARDLEFAKQRLLSAGTLSELEQVAQDIDDRMGEENRDWIGVMKFHDFEIA